MVPLSFLYSPNSTLDFERLHILYMARHAATLIYGEYALSASEQERLRLNQQEATTKEKNK